MLLRAIAAILLSLSAGAALGQAVGDPAAGYAYAVDFCADCHGVEPREAASPEFLAPSFQMLANNPEISELALTAFFQTPHPSMPNFIVTGENARDLIAYIDSLDR